MDGSQTSEEKQEIELKGTCPYCLSTLDVYLDKKKRPYWTCLPCGTRTFATKAAFTAFKEVGWIWEQDRPLKELQAWLKRIAATLGLRVKAK